MKLNKYAWMLGLAGMMSLGACEKLEDFGDTNVNPAATTTPILGALLTNVEAGLGGYAAMTRGAFYAQQLSETQYTDASLYSLPQLEFSGEYAGALYDLQNIINLNQSNNMTQVARILKSYIFWTITDRWGDVPYTEALKGNPTPKYDPQETIYKGCIAELASAVGSFDGTSVITGDIINGGNVAKWKKVANSIRMLMALRLSKRFPGAGEYAATEFKAALNDANGHISTNADNWIIVYPGGAAFRNPWYNTYDGRKDVAESKTMTDLLASLGDGRAQVFGGATEDQNKSNSMWDDPSTIGFPYGVKRATAEAFSSANPTWARVLRGDLREQTDQLVLIGAAELLLARAEAADRGWTTENATTLYQNGITASFQQWGLAAPAATYFTQAGVAFGAPTGTGANLNRIAVQRWIAIYPNGLQAWSEWRRTGFPVLTPAIDAVNSSKQIPRRYTYGTGEYGTNPDNVKTAAGGIQGGDVQDGRVWWDKP
ncbi:MAG TPA: SusD/RagB family nutrient-binding outer membrane lipoprotein [Chitinophagaceae bacterium]